MTEETKAQLQEVQEITGIRLLKPGLLVSLSARIIGGTQYAREVMEREHYIDDKATQRAYQTVIVVLDKAEDKEAKRVRSAARSAISRVCGVSDFALLCPFDKAGRLLAGVKDARALVGQFNKSARTCRLAVGCSVGKVGGDKEQELAAAREIAALERETVASIKEEVRELVAAMRQGIEAADPKQIRKAAGKAAALSKVLRKGTAATRVLEAVKGARDAARGMLKEIKKGAEKGSIQVAVYRSKALDNDRFAFLDLDATPDAAPAAALPDLRAAALDLSCSPAEVAQAEPAAMTPTLDMGKETVARPTEPTVQVALDMSEDEPIGPVATTTEDPEPDPEPDPTGS